MKLQKECGVTDISLENARAICDELGAPDVVQLEIVNSPAQKLVHVSWGDGTLSGNKYCHTSTGFGWGYNGKGPRGLYEFFKLIGLDSVFSMGAIAAFQTTEEGLFLEVTRSGWVIERVQDAATIPALVS